MDEVIKRVQPPAGATDISGWFDSAAGRGEVSFRLPGQAGWSALAVAKVAGRWHGGEGRGVSRAEALLDAECALRWTTTGRAA